MMKKWELLDSEYVLNTPYAKVRRDRVRLSNGLEIGDYYVYEVSDWVRVVPFDEQGDLVMVEQYRHALGEVTMEFPAGRIDAEDASPLEAARRELREETGYVSRKWIPLGSYHIGPARFVNRFHLFCALECTRDGGQNLDATEEIRVFTLPVAEYEKLFETGKIHDVDSATGWLLCNRKGLVASARSA